MLFRYRSIHTPSALFRPLGSIRAFCALFRPLGSIRAFCALFRPLGSIRALCDHAMELLHQRRYGILFPNICTARPRISIVWELLGWRRRYDGIECRWQCVALRGRYICSIESNNHVYMCKYMLDVLWQRFNVYIIYHRYISKVFKQSMTCQMYIGITRGFCTSAYIANFCASNANHWELPQTTQ